ncbi:MAG: hypothetical protein FWF73_03220 [Spirochaetes bacterium]|nr:hypothetical protein [Spirochaetota bacterium]
MVLSDAGGDDSSSGPSLTIEANGTAINSLTLVSYQEVTLRAVYKDEDGVEQTPSSVAWTRSHTGLGSFYTANTATAVFKATSGSISGTNVFIQVECDGLTKKIPAKVESMSIGFSYSGGNNVVNTGSKQITATVTRNGVTDTTASITWSTSNPTYPGNFLPNPSSSGQTVTYTPLIPSGMTGSIYVEATAYGVSFNPGIFNITN